MNLMRVCIKSVAISHFYIKSTCHVDNGRCEVGDINAHHLWGIAPRRKKCDTGASEVLEQSVNVGVAEALGRNVE